MVAWLRDYLTARDLTVEVAGGSVVASTEVGYADGKFADADHAYVENSNADPAQAGRADVDHLSAKLLPLKRLPAPLPPAVRRVAVIALIVFAALCGVGVLFVVCGGIAVVLMPIVMGREGVGTAMITLFAVCVTFVVSGILLLAARGAARVIRRERRGVRTLYSFAVATVVLAAIALAITQWLSVAFLANDNTDVRAFNWTIPVRLFELLAMMLFVWVAVIVRRYDRDLSDRSV